MEFLADILYVISSVLLIPVMAALVGFCIWSLYETGVFLREAWERRSLGKTWQKFQSQQALLKADICSQTLRTFFDVGPLPGLLGDFATLGSSVRNSPLQLTHLASNLEIQASKRLSSLNVGVRIAPMLGLMGTLIPLGPALIGLSQGDLESLAQNLVVAFSTTIVGLFAGGVCYLLGHWRRHWYSRDMAAIDFVCSGLTATAGE